MWYNSTTDLDYTKPIGYIDSITNDKYILMPCILTGSYDVVGYNWFNLTTGRFSSCRTFESVDLALGVIGYSQDIMNVELELVKLSR